MPRPDYRRGPPYWRSFRHGEFAVGSKQSVNHMLSLKMEKTVASRYALSECLIQNGQFLDEQLLHGAVLISGFAHNLHWSHISKASACVGLGAERREIFTYPIEKPASPC